jgi:formylglycine-generating enzyme
MMSPYRLIFTVVASASIAVASCGRTTPPSATQTTSIVLASQASAPLPAEVESRGVTPGDEACPEGMLLVEGEYCPNVHQECLRWLDPPGDRYEFFRCAEYAKPATCKGTRVYKRFCIDETERVEQSSGLPLNKKSWTDATQICPATGARLCMTSEW